MSVVDSINFYDPLMDDHQRLYCVVPPCGPSHVAVEDMLHSERPLFGRHESQSLMLMNENRTSVPAFGAGSFFESGSSALEPALDLDPEIQNMVSQPLLEDFSIGETSTNSHHGQQVHLDESSTHQPETTASVSCPLSFSAPTTTRDDLAPDSVFFPILSRAADGSVFTPPPVPPFIVQHPNLPSPGYDALHSTCSADQEASTRLSRAMSESLPAPASSCNMEHFVHRPALRAPPSKVSPREQKCRDTAEVENSKRAKEHKRNKPANSELVVRGIFVVPGGGRGNESLRPAKRQRRR